MTLVQLRVPDERVEAWDKFVSENPEFSDRSDLIRKSVERTISDEDKGSEGNDGVDEEVVVERFNRLESLLQDVEQEMGIVQADLINEDQLSDIVSNRSYRATQHVLERNDIIRKSGDEEDDGGETHDSK